MKVNGWKVFGIMVVLWLLGSFPAKSIAEGEPYWLDGGLPHAQYLVWMLIGMIATIYFGVMKRWVILSIIGPFGYWIGVSILSVICMLGTMNFADGYAITWVFQLVYVTFLLYLAEKARLERKTQQKKPDISVEGVKQCDEGLKLKEN